MTKIIPAIIALFFALFAPLQSPVFAQDDSSIVIEQIWKSIKTSRNPDYVIAFRQQFPKSKFDQEALALLSTLLVEKVEETDQQETDEARISFLDPIKGYTPFLNGNTIAQLLNSRPLFTPIEGLPDEVWKDKKCSGCHQWTPDDLCVQATHIAKPANANRLEIEHPLGTQFKMVLKDWAEDGCQ